MKQKPHKSPRNKQRAGSELKKKPHKSPEKEKREIELHPYLKALKDADNGLEMLYGYHAVKAALQNPIRQLEALVINPKAQGKVKTLYQKLNDSAPHEFDFIEMEGRYFDLLVGKDISHQSIVLFAHPLEEWHIEDVLDKDRALLMLLDQASDVGNIGAVLRSCAAFGADALIVTERHTPQLTAGLAKAAVGALEHVPIIRVPNLKVALEKLKENDFWIIGCDGHTDEIIEEINVSKKMGLVIGSEGEGLRRLTRESCDFLVKIPMENNVESLNMSVAAAINLYEVSKKMKKL